MQPPVLAALVLCTSLSSSFHLHKKGPPGEDGRTAVLIQSYATTIHRVSNRCRFRAAAARHGLDNLDLFAGTGGLHKVTDVDDPLKASVGPLVLVAVILSRWVRVGCTRLCGVHKSSLWAASREMCRLRGAISLPDITIIPVLSPLLTYLSANWVRFEIQ
jgi:hypothetical protein